MRNIVANTFITLDGVMQAPGGPQEDTSGDFNHGGWIFHYWDDTLGQMLNSFMSKPFDMLLGRKTYDIFAGYWPKIQNDPIADAFNSARKYVVSTTLKKAEWYNSTLINTDVVREINKLKNEGGSEIQVYGSGNLLQTLIKHSLVDEFQIWIFPALIGEGKKLFGDGTIPQNLKLVTSKTSTTGVIICSYQPAGELKTGSVALEEAEKKK